MSDPNTGGPTQGQPIGGPAAAWSGPSTVPAPQRPRDGRFITMIVSGVLAVALCIVALSLPVPYVIESPGPTFNTLGKDSGKPVIQVSGHQTFPADGQLDLVTVSVSGGPNSNVNVVEAYRAWLDSSRSVIPEELLYPPGTSQQEISSQNAVAMTTSQEDATAAALTQLKIPFDTTLAVAAIPEGSASQGQLEPGDVLVSIDGTPITYIKVIQDALAGGNGKAISMEVRRGSDLLTKTIIPQKSTAGKYLLGIALQNNFKFPFDVNISLSNVGGPSAGMMFALGIIDTVTSGDLTGGKHFAGTGTIDPAGNVGAIGGIAQKMIGARQSGATVFLAPAANCGEVVGHVPAGLQVVRVATLQQAEDAVAQIAAGQNDPALPTCTAG
ncbi:PDZ domain-containing protein [Paenarthrobacter sp. PH39-S1]|uniref:YlbL family protein n=1 Tax=Paenarthrobacter sp. PH39-S1 TaxID=3046204 RepID=UPI0024B912C1|nr:PDZ domain-containing protein [Paenarthrobacter sp. PH39-S1]MDJ0355552.1 PDZ domain-containing protein [Paenarthrobacter sp. PH39-S1]